MLIIKNLLGETEALTDVSQAEVLEQVGGNFTLSFAVPNSSGNNHAYHLLEEESIIETEDGHEFRIKSMVENRLGKSGTAQHIFFDLIDAYVYDMIGGTKTVEELLTFVLNGTGWTFTVEGVVNPKNVFNVGENNPLALLKGVLSEFELEYGS